MGVHEEVGCEGPARGKFGKPHHLLPVAIGVDDSCCSIGSEH